MGCTIFILMRGRRPWGTYRTGRAAELERRRLIQEGAAVLSDFEIIPQALEG